MPFTAEELAAMRAADAEIERGFSGMTAEEIALARRIDVEAKRVKYSDAQRKKAEYYEKNRERILSRKKEYRAKTSAQRREYQAAYYQRNKEKIRKREAERRLENPIPRRQAAKRYYQRHREEICAKARERRKRARGNEAVAAL